VRTVTTLAIPQPSQLVDVLNLCQSVEAQLPYVEDVAMLKDAAAKMRAIDQYVALTSTEGRQAIAATVRRIEVRVGEVLGEAVAGVNQHSEPYVATEGFVLTHHERHDFRQMAAHPDIVEAEIAKGTDERPTSRRQVIQAIQAKKQELQAQRRSEDAEDAAFVAGLGPANDVAGDRKRQEVHMAIIAVHSATKTLARFTADDIAWAISTAVEHVAEQMTDQLRSALRVLEGRAP
jgi:hypothetical protein